MLVLSVHNQYQQPGGEDVVASAESALLRSHGHEVIDFREHNDRVSELSRLSVGLKTIWSAEAYRQIREVIRESRPSVMHVHNTFPLLSPSIYYAARKMGVPVVQTLHNYRLLCPSAILFRDGRICEDCVGRLVPVPGIRHACYRGSHAGTAAAAAMISAHRVLGTWKRTVDVYVALTEFARRKFIQGGVPADLIRVKPNFVHPDPGMRSGSGSHALFIGRLTEEKGVMTLLRAWAMGVDGALVIVGNGPLLEEAQQFVRDRQLEKRVRFTGQLPAAEVVDLLQNARFLVFPSEWYEGLPRTIVEAFACGVPVLAARLGAAAETVVDGISGRHFKPGYAEDLAEKARAMFGGDALLAEMRKGARAAYEADYSAEAAYRDIMQVYDVAMGRRPLQEVSASA
jgi:glycosyltransferase involved in cell wall biosynthesis